MWTFKTGPKAKLAEVPTLRLNRQPVTFPSLPLAGRGASLPAPFLGRRETSAPFSRRRRWPSRLLLLPFLLLTAAGLIAFLREKREARHLVSPKEWRPGTRTYEAPERPPAVPVTDSTPTAEPGRNQPSVPAVDRNPPSVKASAPEQEAPEPAFEEDRFRRLIGATVTDISGGAVGEIRALYYRSLRNQPEWALVSTGTLERKDVLVPLEGVTPEADRVVVPYPRNLIENAQSSGEDALNEDDEMALYTHYGARRILPGVESARHPERVQLRRWTPEGSAAG